MTVEDVSRILDIERRVFTTPWTAEMFLQEIQRGFGSRSFVATLSGEVVGYTVAWFIEDEVHLVNIAVDPSQQNRGIGSRLLTRIIDEALASRNRIVTLEVRASNVAAQLFYRRFLFRTVAVRRGYYSDNREDAFLMLLDLDDFARRRNGPEKPK